MWRNINTICSFKKPTSKTNISKLVVNKIDISPNSIDPNIISEELNKYFTNVDSSLSQKLPQSNVSHTSFLQNSVRNSMVLADITEQEVSHQISLLPSKKAAESDCFGSSLNN